MYWTHSSSQLATIRQNQTNFNQSAIRMGTLYFYPNDDVTITRMDDQDFFEVRSQNT